MRPELFLTQAPWSTLAAVGRGASGEKDMSLVKTTGKLYTAEVKRTGSGHELGEVGGVTAGCSFFLTQSTLAAVGRGASSEKDMSEVRTTDKLHNTKVKRAGSGHELREAGVSVSPSL